MSGGCAWSVRFRSARRATVCRGYHDDRYRYCSPFCLCDPASPAHSQLRHSSFLLASPCFTCGSSLSPPLFMFCCNTVTVSFLLHLLTIIFLIRFHTRVFRHNAGRDILRTHVRGFCRYLCASNTIPGRSSGACPLIDTANASCYNVYESFPHITRFPRPKARILAHGSP